MTHPLDAIGSLVSDIPGKTFRYTWISKENKHPGHLRFNDGATIDYMRGGILALSDNTSGSYERIREWDGLNKDEHGVVFHIDARIFDGETELEPEECMESNPSDEIRSTLHQLSDDFREEMACSPLTASRVDKIFMECLFQEGESTDTHVLGEGVMMKVGFHPERLAAHKDEIHALLHQLPDDFHEDKGGGMSFLNACMTRDGDQWGEHQNIDQLLTLGVATGQAKILMGREMWSAFPGGLPYFSVTA